MGVLNDHSGYQVENRLGDLGWKERKSGTTAEFKSEVMLACLVGASGTNEKFYSSGNITNRTWLEDRNGRGVEDD